MSSVKSSLASVKTETKKLGEEQELAGKSAEESAQVFIKQWKKADSEFKKNISNIKMFGRELKQVGNEIRNTGLIITGSFVGAFAMARNTVPQVDAELSKIQHSFLHISESISRAALPALKEFSSAMQSLEKSVNKISHQNPELISGFLKLGAVLVAIGGSIAVVGGLVNTIGKVIDAFGKLKPFLPILGAMATDFSLAAIEAFALYKTIEKLVNEVQKLQDSKEPFVNKIKQVTTSAGAILGPGGPIGAGVQAGVSAGAQFGKSLVPGQSASGGADVDLGTINVKKIQEAKQLSQDFLKNDIVAVTAALENVKQKSTQAIEQSLVMAEAVRTNIGNVFTSLADGIGQSVGQAIVFGQNFLESMTQVLKNLAADIISMLVAVIAKIIVLRALGVVGPIPAAALFGGGQGFGEAVGGTGAGKSIGGFFQNLIPFADGGIVNKPTMGLVGEAGPEAIIPLDKMGEMGGSSLHIHSDVIFLQDEAAMDRFYRKGVEAMKRITNRRTGGTSLAF